MSALGNEELARFQSLFHDFSVGFLAPTMTGGTARMTQVLPPHALDTFALSRPTDHQADVETFHAFHRAASEVAPVSQLPYPDKGTWGLAMAAHNALALTDPELDRAFWPSQARRIESWSYQLLRAIGQPRTRGEALMRHAFVRRFMKMGRSDVVVKNWAYTYRFWGRPAPGNVVAFPKLRFVKQFPGSTPMSELFRREAVGRAKLDIGRLFDALVHHSPLTRLLDVEDNEGVTFDPSVLAVVSDPLLRHGVAHQLAVREVNATTSHLGRALQELSDSGADAVHLGAAASFILELAVLIALDRSSTRSSNGGPVALGDASSRIFWACLPVALGNVDALDPLQDFPARDRRRLGEWASSIDERLDDETRNLVRRIFREIAVPWPSGPIQIPSSPQPARTNASEAFDVTRESTT